MAYALLPSVIGIDHSTLEDSLEAPDGASMIGSLEDVIVDGTISTPSIVALSAADYVFLGHFFGDYYFRIWVIPPLLRVLNPKIDIAIPFQIWNAYPLPLTNDLTAVSGTGLTGLTLSFIPTVTYKAIELKAVTITITATAPREIDAEFIFTFDNGAGLFRFLAVTSQFFGIVADAPVQETWVWLTDVIVTENGQEQRIALRDGPRTLLSFSMLIEDFLSRKQMYRDVYKKISVPTVIPYWQYGARITQDAALGTTQLYFDPARTDLRNEDYAVIFDLATGIAALVVVATMGVDGAILDTPLQINVTAGMIICPGILSSIQDRMGFAMQSIAGKIQLNTSSFGARAPLTRPGSTISLSTFDGYNVLNRRPMAMGDVPEIFEANYELMDGLTGRTTIKTHWPHPAMSGEREFLIQRLFAPNEMDFWRTFLDAIKGRQKAFLAPTYRDDLVKLTNPSQGGDTFTVVEDGYVADYFPYQTYKRLQIETAGGILWRRVLAATDNGDGTSTIQVDIPFPSNAPGVDIRRVSFLNLVRLSQDTVEIDHNHLESRLKLLLRTIDA